MGQEQTTRASVALEIFGSADPNRARMILLGQKRTMRLTICSGWAAV